MISVVIASYGEQQWAELAEIRAYPSAINSGAEVILEHQPHGDIATARNAGAKRAHGRWLCFLDADDELAPGFIQAMTDAIDDAEPGVPPLLTPRVSYVRSGRRETPKFWREIPLNQGNWLVIGTLVERGPFEAVGGFDSWPLAYEDWALFAKCWRAGTPIVKVPEAIYLAHAMPNSRNHAYSPAERIRIHYEIGRELFPDDYPESWLERHLGNCRGCR